MFVSEEAPPRWCFFFFRQLRRASRPREADTRSEAPTNRDSTKKSAEGGAGETRGHKGRSDEREHGRTGTTKKKEEQKKRAPVKTGTQGKDEREKATTKAGKSNTRKGAPTRPKPHSVVPLDNGTEQPRGEDGAEKHNTKRERSATRREETERRPNEPKSRSERRSESRTNRNRKEKNKNKNSFVHEATERDFKRRRERTERGNGAPRRARERTDTATTALPETNGNYETPHTQNKGRDLPFPLLDSSHKF